MENKLNLEAILEYISPSGLNYEEWVHVGMALKHEGYPMDSWDKWSQKDFKRYHGGECQKKWQTFESQNNGITGATITQMAKDNGWVPLSATNNALDWDDVIGESDDYKIIDTNWVEKEEIKAPGSNWDGVKDLILYLETLFEASENVGYVTRAWEMDGKWLPTKGAWDRTAGKLIEELDKCNGDIGAVLGDYNEAAGAWIRFNPLDGKGIKNENVTDYRYALVESDSMDIDTQNAIIRELELPVAILVHSGKKSLHAIVKVDAVNKEEYRKRVDYLYNICKKNGLMVDQQNRNPSRLSRMPGVIRNGNKQYVLDTNIGKGNWEEWHEWIESINDDLPEPESLVEYWDDLPALAPPLIEGMLRQGHKMLIAGPSKAGKSFALIEMCIAIAEGRKWIHWPCTQGRILYVNLELDRASCLHRFKDVYTRLGWKPTSLNNIDIWNLRGKSVPMDKLAPKLIRRAAKKDYIAIVIDPIYKILTGDENSADQMAHFTNQFDKVCTELGSSVIYCHHHSKGYQGSKRSMDRASGSGVFARDPDALIDLVELELNDNVMIHQEQQAEAKALYKAILKFNEKYADDHIGLDDICSDAQMRNHVKNALNAEEQKQAKQMAEEAVGLVNTSSAWRMEGTLREFPKFDPVNMWFRYPVHEVDEVGILKDIQVEGERPAWQKNNAPKKSKDEKLEERSNQTEIAFSALEIDNEMITVDMLAEELEVSKKTVWRRIKEHGALESYKIEGEKESFIRRKNDD